MSCTVFKYLAVFSMLLDHIAVVFFEPESFAYLLLRGLGRAAFPIFSYLLVQGFVHTRDLRKYILRLLAFGVLAEIPFDLAAFGTVCDFRGQNTLFTLALALVVLDALSKVERGKCSAATLCAGLLAAAASVLFNTDYGIFGILLIVVLYVWRSDPMGQLLAILVFGLCTARGIYFPAFLATGICLRFGNGKRGNLRFSQFFYWFYPAHLLILVCLKMLIR